MKKLKLFLCRHHGFFPGILCVIPGLAAGVPGVFAGIAAGFFINSVMAHLYEERAYSKIIESGARVQSGSEPFPGALYVCALAVYLFREHALAVRYLRLYLGRKDTAVWNLFCSAAVRTSGISSDLLVESLAASLLSGNNLPQAPVHQIFSLLKAGESDSGSNQHTIRPSEYLADLLQYSYARSDLEDAYRILGVPFDAAASIVKKAHRQLARKYHPDRSSGGGGAQFQKIQEAYECICRFHSLHY